MSVLKIGSTVQARLPNRRLAQVFLTCVGCAFAGYGITWSVANTLIKHDADLEAKQWSKFIHSSQTDFESLLVGLRPSVETQHLLEHARDFGQVVEIAFYNNKGVKTYHQNLKHEDSDVDPHLSGEHVKLAQGQSEEAGEDSEEDGNLLERYPQLQSASLSFGDFITSIRAADDEGETGLESEVVLPYIHEGKSAGYLLVELDQTERWDGLVSSFRPFSYFSAFILGLLPMGVSAFMQRKTRDIETLAKALGTDALTGIGSRQALYDFEKTLNQEGRGLADGTAVFYLDVDKFKYFNDNFGHEFGDDVLKSIGAHAQELSQTYPSLRAFRLGGDEFIFILQGVKSETDAMHFANDLNQISFQFNSQNSSKPTCSVGAFLQTKSSGERNFDRALARADAALYASKSKGGNTSTLFDSAMDAEWENQKVIGQLLMQSEASKPFVLHYQPCFDLQTGELRSFEALIRMRGHDGKLISPDKFIPLAERNGAIEHIGARCLISACIEASRWPKNIVVAVNISPVQFRSGNLVVHIKTALELAGIKANQLEIEITESILVEDVANVTSQLEDIKALGVSIALDDFGTGYSSLNYLWRFPFNKIKIDKSFVQKIDTDEGAFKILSTIIDLAQQLNFEATAEGIETDLQRLTLKELGCALGQGYFFSKPVEDEQARLIILRSLATSAKISQDGDQDMDKDLVPLYQLDVAATS